MTNKQINERRRLSHVYDQVEKEELFETIIKSYGKAMYTIDELKTDNKLLRAENRMLFDIIKMGGKK
jgi:hypothetical protein